MGLVGILSERARPVVPGGAIGTQLAAHGLERGRQNCVAHPDVVRGIQDSYARLDVDVLLTNTLTISRAFVETHAVGLNVAEVNLAGAEVLGFGAGHGAGGDWLLKNPSDGQEVWRASRTAQAPAE